MPSSQDEARDRANPAEEGFIEASRPQPKASRSRLVLRLKYVEGRTPVVPA